MEFRPLGNKCRSEQVVEQIMNMIEAGELRPGDKLPSEPELARQLGISRGILREGMAQLKAQGIISRKPKDGTYILPQEKDGGTVAMSARRMIKISTFRNIMEMRDAIEQMAAVLAVERATDEELEELREITMKWELQVDKDDLDYYFHYRLVELSGNSIFMGIVDSYFEEIREIRNENIYKPAHKQEVCQEHLAIVDAICRRDRDAAKEAVANHMLRIWERWRDRHTAEEV